MASQKVTLDQIVFADTTTTEQSLQHPLYGNLVDYGVVDSEIRKVLQLEPAFQFLKDVETDTFEFIFKIHPLANACFALKEHTTEPVWKKITPAPVYPKPVKSVELVTGSNRKICKVVLEPSTWPEGANIIVLRIYCNRPSDKSWEYADTDGVSISFIRHVGSKIMTAAKKDPVTEALAIHVTNFVTDPVTSVQIPKYNVFKKVSLPPSVSLEPAFRVSPDRPEVNVKIVLDPPKLRFMAGTVTAGEVELISRDSSGRPAELSQVVAPKDQRSLKFSWLRPPAAVARAFGFYAPVEEWVFEAQSYRRRKIFIDPIVYHDPPPG